ncbi:MAG: four helix bundle protein [Anaerolineales bacterium]|nr:four helix bundle protein [Anaerolineales bacterium]
MTELHLPGYRNLKVWRMAFELAREVYMVTRAFPKGHYRLIDQMLGASASVHGNIAEGYCRNRLGSYVNSCEIARGELGELISYIHQCEQEGLIAGEAAGRINLLCNNLWPALGGLIATLDKKLRSGEWDNILRPDVS